MWIKLGKLSPRRPICPSWLQDAQFRTKGRGKCSLLPREPYVNSASYAAKTARLSRKKSQTANFLKAKQPRITTTYAQKSRRFEQKIDLQQDLDKRLIWRITNFSPRSLTTIYTWNSVDKVNKPSTGILRYTCSFSLITTTGVTILIRKLGLRM